MVNELLRAMALVARGEGSAGGFGVLAGFQSSRLCVVMNVIDDHSPFTFDVPSSFRHCVGHITGANVPFRTCDEIEIMGNCLTKRCLDGKKIDY